MSHRRLLGHRGLLELAGHRQREVDLEDSIETQKEKQRSLADFLVFSRSRKVPEHGNFGADSTNNLRLKDEPGSGKIV